MKIHLRIGGKPTNRYYIPDLREEQIKNNSTELAKKIFDTLQSKNFTRWYSEGNFDFFVFNRWPRYNDVTREMILEDIKTIFKL